MHEFRRRHSSLPGGDWWAAVVGLAEITCMSSSMEALAAHSVSSLHPRSPLLGLGSIKDRSRVDLVPLADGWSFQFGGFGNGSMFTLGSCRRVHT